MGKCCPCYHRKSNKYETLAKQTGKLSSQFYCCEHTRSTLIRNTQTSDLENQENLIPNCDCNKMDAAVDVGKEAIDEAVSAEVAEMINNTVDFMNTEKVELCKVWSEQKIRKEWTETNVVSSKSNQNFVQ